MIANFICRDCRAKCWCDDGDPVSRIRLKHRICAPCNRAALDDVRARFGAVVRREAARVAPVEPLPSALGFVLGALVVAALVASLVRPGAVDGLLSGAIVAGIAWFAQLAARFLA